MHLMSFMQGLVAICKIHTDLMRCISIKHTIIQLFVQCVAVSNKTKYNKRNKLCSRCLKGWSYKCVGHCVVDITDVLRGTRTEAIVLAMHNMLY